MNKAELIAREMATWNIGPGIQLAQTAMRMQLVEVWNIPRGSRVLEIGCGQGDLTAVLADSVGSKGYVMAVDAAEPGYGAPLTIGVCTSHLSASRYGKTIDFLLDCDVLDRTEQFRSERFDYVVLAHSSWYFDSVEMLEKVLQEAHMWAPHLCISDWNLEPSNPAQFAHMLSVLIQGQIEAFQENSQSNIRSPYTISQFTELMSKTGWSIDFCQDIDCSALLDGQWEIDTCMNMSEADINNFHLPTRFMSIIDTQLDLLSEVARKHGRESLNSYAILANSTR